MSRTAKSSKSASGRKAAPRKQTTRRASEANSGSGGKVFFAFIAGVAVGCVLAAMLLQSDGGEVEQAGGESSQSAPAAKAPRYEFFQLLQEEEEVVVDAPPIEEPKTIVTGTPKPESLEPAPTEQFFLQAGSFKSRGDADGRRVQLLLMNLEAYIEPVQDKKGAQWYRVVVGPFSDRGSSTEARNKLATNGVESLVLKRKI